jgi:two-component system response regulator FlrC
LAASQIEVEVEAVTQVEVAPLKTSCDSLGLGVAWVSSTGESATTLLSSRRRTLVVGRGDGCDVVLKGDLVSRRHAGLSNEGEHWLVRDLGSRNGVWLDGRAAKCAALRTGSVLRIGSWVGVVRPLRTHGVPFFRHMGDGLYGGPEIADTLALVDRVSSSHIAVVLEGETGTGKELFGRAVHRRSRRAGPFLATNCAVYQPSTAAVELFGHRKGAFTGATEAHNGLLRAARGGTLLLDEIVDLAPDVQAQLLRAIERREILPMGESHPVTVDVRFVAATQKPLSEAVAAGRLRADLRARLEGIRISIPPLRLRLGDAPHLMFQTLRDSMANPPEVEAPVLEWLCLYEWPLNVRELVALVHRIVAVYPDAVSLSLKQLSCLLPDVTGRVEEPPEVPRRRRVDSRAFSPEMMTAFGHALERHSGNVAKAAAELEITRQRAYRMLKIRSKAPPDS